MSGTFSIPNTANPLRRYDYIKTLNLEATTITGSTISGSQIIGTTISATNFSATNITGSTTVSGSNIQGSSGTFTASTYSGSVLTLKGNVVLTGFKVTGSVTLGDVLVVSSDSDDYLSGSKQNMPTTIIGVAANSASNNTAVQLVKFGVVTLMASGSITRGTTVGSAGLSGSNYVATSVAEGTILGTALNNAATNAAVRVLLDIR